MPASMISAATGATLKVMGSSIAIVASGPMPGSTPMRVPRKQPMKQYQRFCQVSATLKPNTRLWNSSILITPQALDEWIRQAQAVYEHPGTKDGEANGQGKDFLPLEFPAGGGGQGDQHQHRGNEPGLLHQPAEHGGCDWQHDQGADRPVTLEFDVVLHAHHHDEDAEADHDRAQHDGE